MLLAEKCGGYATRHNVTLYVRCLSDFKFIFNEFVSSSRSSM